MQVKRTSGHPQQVGATFNEHLLRFQTCTSLVHIRKTPAAINEVSGPQGLKFGGVAGTWATLDSHHDLAFEKSEKHQSHT